jgi:hypothetical protein
MGALELQRVEFFLLDQDVIAFADCIAFDLVVGFDRFSVSESIYCL